VRVRGAFGACTGVSQDELSEFDIAQGQHAVGNCLKVSAAALHDDDLQAAMMIKMNMRDRRNHRTGGVLNFGQLLGEIRDVMVVDKRQSADYRLVRFNARSKMRRANKIAERLGAVRVTVFGNEPIELLLQAVFERNPGSAQL